MAEKRFGLFRRREVKSASDNVATASPVLVEALQLFDGGMVSYGTAYRRLHPVRTVVDFIADAISSTPLKVYRWHPDGREELRDHPYAQLLREPNPSLPGERLIGEVARDLLIYGNAYVRKVDLPRKRYLVPLPPFRVTPIGGDLLAPAAYDFFPPSGGAPQRFDAEEIVHLKLYDPEDRRVGSSKLEALKPILREEVEASRHRTGYWRNKAAPDGVLKTPESLSEEAYDRLRVDWDNRVGGSVNSGKTVILEEGLEFQGISFSPKDSEFVQGRQFILEATAHVFNLPLPLLSLTQSATYASQREFHKQLYTEVLPPWFGMIQSEFDLQLRGWFSDVTDVYSEFLVESKLRGDFIDQIEVISKALGGGSTPGFMLIEEARHLFNLPPLDDPRASALIVPANVNLDLAGSEPAALASVTPLPQRAASLIAFFDRQERSVLPKLGAKSVRFFDRERWDGELGRLLGDAELAAKVNLETELELSESDDPRSVFDRARRVRAPLIQAQTVTA